MVNLKSMVTPKEIQAIAALSETELTDLTNRIKATDPRYLFDAVEKNPNQVVCPFCGSGTHGNKNTGVEIRCVDGVWLFHCFAQNDCNGTLLDVVAQANNLSARGKDFLEVLAIAANITGQYILPADSTPTKNPATEFERLDEAKNNLPSFVEKQGGTWRGLSLDTLQRLNCGFLHNVYFPTAEKYLPAVVIPNDLNGVYFRSTVGKFHKNFSPTATTTVYLPDADNFDVIITEGAINAASIFQAVHDTTNALPDFGIIASGGTSGNANVLAKLQQLRASGKSVRAIIAYDNDSNRAGTHAAENLSKILSDASFEFCIVDYTKTPDRDVSDLLNANEGTFKLANVVFSEFQNISRAEEQNLFGENSAVFFSDIFPAYVEQNQKFADRKTGFENLDDELKSFLPGVYVLGGLPALGKTTFALQLLDQLATNGNHCFYVSFEMLKGFLYSKLLAREVARIETNNFQRQIAGKDYSTGKEIYRLTATQISLGKIHDFHQDAYYTALHNFKNNPKPLYIWEENKLDVDKLLTRLEKICAKIPNPPVICLDYLQLFAAGSENAKSTLDDVLFKIFSFRRRTNCTFIIISSLNRANYQTEISFESFKESGSIEYSADAIWGLQLLLDKRTPADAEKAKKEIPRRIQLKCLKNRFGSNFDIGFFYYPSVDLFIPMLEYGEFTEHRAENVSSADDDDGDNAG